MRIFPAVILGFLSLITPVISRCQTASTTWFTLNVRDGDTIAATGSITLRYGQVASICAVTMSAGPCAGVPPGTPTPEAWTNPQTFTASPGNTVAIVVGAAAFGYVDPLPGVYKTVQVAEQATPQQITVDGLVVTVPALTSSSAPASAWFTLNVNDGDTITATGSITLRYGQVASTCAVMMSTGPCAGAPPGTPTPEAWTNPETFTPSSGGAVTIVVGAAAFGNVDPLPGVYKTIQVAEQATPQNITVDGRSVTVPALSSSSTLTWFTLTVNDGDTIAATGSITLRYGQVASTCAVTMSTGPCAGAPPGTPTPAAWTNPQTFTVSSGNTVSIVVGAAAFGNVDPLPGVYKTVQIAELATPQNITVRGQPVTVPALSTSSTCQLISTPSSIAFSNTTVGFTISSPASIVSTCTTSITITSVQSSGPPFTASGFQTPFSLAPNQSQSYTAIFGPTATGTATGSLVFASSSSGVQTLTVPLTGTGVATQKGILSSSATTLSFGNVTVNNTQTQTVTITNTGAASVSISAVSVSGAGFSLGSVQTPITLATNKSIQLTVGFTPTISGSSTGAVTITSNAQNATLTVPLTGTGVAVAHSVALSWSETGTQIAGYNMYRSITSSGSPTKINGTLIPSTNYSDQAVASGTTYYYTVTAVGTNGIESAPSNQAIVSVP